MARSLLLLLSIPALACSDYAIEQQEPTNQAAPTIQVDPLILRFGGVEMDTTAEAWLEISNAGNAGLTLLDLGLEADGPFGVDLAQVGASIEPGGSLDLRLDYTPRTREDLGTLVIGSDDPDTPSLSVPLEGEGLLPELELHPQVVDLGDVLPGCETTSTVSLRNIGGADLTLSALAPSDGAFSAELPVGLPTVMAPGDALSVELSWLADEVGEHTATLWAASDDPAGDKSAGLVGEVVTPSLVEQEWTQPSGPWGAVDFLFTIDRSGSMDDNNDALAGRASSFMASLQAKDLDARVMVVTEDDGCSNGGIFEAAEPAAASRFAAALKGEAGSYTEAGLRLSSEAMGLIDTGECNAGFVRDGSLTSIVMISDEADQSPGGWSSHVDLIRAAAPSATLNAIAGDYPDGCTSADAGAGYYEATVATGGIFLSICDGDWDHMVEVLAAQALEAPTDTFELEQEPVEDSIEVRVDDELVLEGWTWEAEPGAVVFTEEAMPPAGSHVGISYWAAYDCPS